MRMEAIVWLQSLCCYLRRSQSKTLAALAMAARSVVRFSFAAIGHHLKGLTRHDIKRVDRFLGNPRIRVSDAMAGLIEHLLRRRGRSALVIAMGWMAIRPLHALALVQVGPGRGMALAWGVVYRLQVSPMQARAALCLAL